MHKIVPWNIIFDGKNIYDSDWVYWTLYKNSPSKPRVISNYLLYAQLKKDFIPEYKTYTLANLEEQEIFRLGNYKGE